MADEPKDSPLKTKLERREGLRGDRLISPGLTADSVPKQAALPSVAEISKLSDAQLADLLQHYGITEPWGTLQTRAAAYVERMTQLRPGTPEFEAELNRITTTMSRRGATALARRAQERFSSLDAINGNVNQTMIWVLSEIDENNCDRCIARAGQIATYAEWQTLGPPGAAVCEGGDYDRCQLVVID